jgi:hypothetical protein
VNTPTVRATSDARVPGRILGPLHAVANRCATSSCPTIYTAESDSAAVVVQGFVVSAAQSGIDVPEGEALVEIPYELLLEAVRNLS